jgi:exodeoxyribonuclease V alpha subunit
VLRDVLSAGIVPVATLQEVYRQAADSGIVRNAHRVNGGVAPLSGEREGGRRDFFVLSRPDVLAAQATLLEVVAERLPAQGFDPRGDVQVLAPMHRGPLGIAVLNERLQALLNPAGAELRRRGRLLRVGDRVIQTKNDYGNDVFNGDVGLVVDVDADAATVDFDGRPVALAGDQLDHLELAYAITIHKSQGSEYPAVVIALHRAHRVMLRRNLLYTAITRARRFCCLVGDPWAVRTACENPSGDERWTRLAERMAMGG